MTESTPQRNIVILLLASAPDDLERVEISREFNEIDEKIRHSQYRDHFTIHQKWNVPADELTGVLMRFEPDIFHFSGHGTALGDLLFALPTGDAIAARSSTIAALFRIIPGVRCVVLNACFSADLAESIAAHVDVVIGMSRSVGDRDSIVFTTGFYEALGYGRSLGQAFELAKLRIDLAGCPDQDVPRAFARPGVDAQTLYLHVAPSPLTPPTPRVEPPRASPPSPPLTAIEKHLLEEWLGMKSGYVLDFTNRSFEAFIRDTVGLEIYDDRYAEGSGSKANRLRALWSNESSTLVGRLLLALVEYCELVHRKDDEQRRARAKAIAERLVGSSR